MLNYQTSYSNSSFSLFTLIPSKITAATTNVVTVVTTKKRNVFIRTLLVFFEGTGIAIDHLFKKLIVTCNLIKTYKRIQWKNYLKIK